MKVALKRRMKMEMTLYHRRKDGGVKVWMARLDGNKVHQSWGVHEKKIQTTTHVVKGNDRQTAEERARHRFDTLVEHRENRGYVRKLGAVADSTVLQDGELDFDRLPRKFAPAKPKKHIDFNTALAWEKEGKLSIQRKWDGMRHRIVSDSKARIKIYSSSNHDVTEALLPLVPDLKLPPRTILDAELTAVDHEGRDSFKTVASVARSLPKKAHQAIKDARARRIYVCFYAFDMLYDHGKPTYKLAYAIRRGAMVKLLHGQSVGVAQETGSSLQKSAAAVKKLGWEGLVIWRTDQPTVVRTAGSPERTNCWKIKFVNEEDVVATGYELGKGRNSKCVGKLRISFGGRPMGKCGTGLDDRTREEALGWKYPCVIQIEYDSMSEKGFRFPVFIRKRDDKVVGK